MAKYVKLSAQQKEEIRRLTQLANRRIASAFKTYEKEGKDIVPAEVTGGITIREQWNSKNYALSRSTKFNTMKEYREQLHYLRQFEVMRPTITEYTDVQRQKTMQAIETSLGYDVPPELRQAISKMTAPQLASYWKNFSDKGAKAGMKYSSDAVMLDNLSEVFREDIKHVTKAG